MLVKPIRYKVTNKIKPANYSIALNKFFLFYFKKYLSQNKVTAVVVEKQAKISCYTLSVCFLTEKCVVLPKGDTFPAKLWYKYKSMEPIISKRINERHTQTQKYRNLSSKFCIYKMLSIFWTP